MPGLQVRMLGLLTMSRDGAVLELAASRKLRALFAFLALAPHAVGRSRLCDLLWDVPNDPRGELRWCLSKLRSVLDEPDRRRVETSGDMVRLDLVGCFVDAIEIAAATDKGLEDLDADRLRTLAGLFAGDFLEGLEIDRSPQFNSWLIAHRRRFRACHAAILEHLVNSLPAHGEEMLQHLDKWVELSPFDARAHVSLLGALAARNQIAECEEHLAATARQFESEDLDFGPVRDAWRALRNRTAGATRPVQAAGVPAVSPLPVDGGEVGTSAPRRASLAVMPFADYAGDGAGDGARGGLADGLTHDIIARLSKLRSLFIIARGSVFALAERSIGPEDAGRRLNVDYVTSGAVRHQQNRLVVTVELLEARTARVVWAEAFDRKPDDAFAVLDEIGDRIVASIANEIETAETSRAILKPPNSLDAWEAYHRGLWHMYRFTRSENEQARHFFDMAINLDPTFARAHAGLSFTHWQNAFQRWADRERESHLAYEAAGRSLMVDEQDPTAHWAMGRALWLRGRHDDSLGELERAVDLSPNFALGHYALSFVQSQSGDPQAAIGASDYSRELSPFDPLLFAMMGTRAMAHARLGQFDEAAQWAVKAAGRHNAHANIQAIAAYCLALAGRAEEGQSFVASIRKTRPDYCNDDFLGTFKFAVDAEALFRKTGGHIGLA